MDQIGYADIVATGAMAVGLLSLFLHWRRHLLDQENRAPDIRLKASPMEEIPGWSKLNVSIRNNDGFRLEGERVSILWPPSGKIVRFTDCFILDGYGGWRALPEIPPEKIGRSSSLSVDMAQAGQEQRMASYGRVRGSGAEDHEDFLVAAALPLSRRFRSSTNQAFQRTLVCRISMSSTRSSRRHLKSIRRVTITIAPQANSSQSAASE